MYEGLKKLEKALQKRGKSLRMHRAIFGHIKAHPVVQISLVNIRIVYEGLGELEKAFEMYEQSLKMDLVTLGRTSPILLSLRLFAIMHSCINELVSCTKL